MIVASSPAAFAAAVDDYVFEDVELDTAGLAPGGLLLVGEGHGRHETPSVLYALGRSVEARALGLEWSHDELDGLVQAFLRGGEFAYDLFWELPATAEVFARDGRFTAGHVALLRRLRDEGRLEQVILFDRLDATPDPDWRRRDRELAERLLDEWRGAPLLAVAGAFHVAVDNEGTMAWHLAKERPDLRTAMLHHEGSAPMPRAPFVFELPPATPATVPGRSD